MSGAEVLAYREVPLGGLRAMSVRRTLPQVGRSTIGAWCFIDHFGPDAVAVTGGMTVGGHPHTGLQTATWLFAGEVEHRDTTGGQRLVRPGELNLMTAGRGIAHSEYSSAATTSLHGVQLWIALPEGFRDTSPGLVHHVPDRFEFDGCRVALFLGELFGRSSPVATHSPLVGAEVLVPAGTRLHIEVDPAHEHGVLADAGQVALGAVLARPGELIFAPAGRRHLELTAPAGPARMLLLGGEPLGEQIVMWWNFVGCSHEEIVEFRADWQRERSHRRGGRYGPLPDEWTTTIPAPELPSVRLRPRG